MASECPLGELIDAAESLYRWSLQTLEDPRTRNGGHEERNRLFARFREAYDAAGSVNRRGLVEFSEWQRRRAVLRTFRDEIWYRATVHQPDNPELAAELGIATERSVDASVDAIVVYDREDFCEQLEWWRDLAGQLAARDTQEAKAGKEQNPAKPRKHTNVNARMLEQAAKDSEAMAWTARQWADHLKCVKSSVHNAEAWRMFAPYRDVSQAGRRADRWQRKLKNSPTEPNA